MAAQPTLTVISTTPGTKVTQFQQIIFRVEDAAGALAQVLVSVNLDVNEPDELLFNGTVFSKRYDKLSSIESIADGFEFTVLRERGWVATPVFTAYAVDLVGNVLP